MNFLPIPSSRNAANLAVLRLCLSLSLFATLRLSFFFQAQALQPHKLTISNQILQPHKLTNANQSLQSRKLKISTKYSSESANMSLFATLIKEFPSYPKFKKCSLSRLPPTLRLCLSSPHFEFSSSPKFRLSNLTTSTKIRLRLDDSVSLRHNSQSPPKSLRLYLSLFAKVRSPFLPSPLPSSGNAA